MKDLLSSIKKEDYVSISGKVTRSLKMKMEVILNESNLNINQYIKHMAEALVSGKNLFEEKESEFRSLISTKNAENKRLINKVSELESLLRNSNNDVRLLKNKLMEVDYFEKDFKVKEDSLKNSFQNRIEGIKKDYETRISVLKKDSASIIENLEGKVALYRNLNNIEQEKGSFTKDEIGNFVEEINRDFGTSTAIKLIKTKFFESLKKSAK